MDRKKICFISKLRPSARKLMRLQCEIIMAAFWTPSNDIEGNRGLVYLRIK